MYVTGDDQIYRSQESGSLQESVPDLLARLSTLGTYAFILGFVLMGISFVTNPIPDPSFPWATLSPSLRISYTQPRIEHWPVTYTIGLWSVVFTLPLVLLKSYQWNRSQVPIQSSLWLTGLPVSAMLSFTTYCRFFWPKLSPPTWNAPSYTVVCWLYCSTYDPLWSNLAYGVAFFGVGTTYLAYRNSSFSRYALAAFGMLAFPLGVPALFDAYRRHTR